MDPKIRRAEFKSSALAFIRDSEVEITDKWLRKSRDEIKFINRILDTPYEEIKQIFSIDELLIFYRRKRTLEDLIISAYRASMENERTSSYIKMLKLTKKITKTFKIEQFPNEFINKFQDAFSK